MTPTPPPSGFGGIIRQRQPHRLILFLAETWFGGIRPRDRSSSVGTNIAQSPAIGSASLNWRTIGVGNFTGNPGILWVNSNTGQLSVWTMSGSVVPGIANISVGGTGVPGTVQAIGDFHGNGKSDLIVHNSPTGGTWMATNQGNLHFSLSSLPSVKPIWKIVGVADLAGTGTPQLI